MNDFIDKLNAETAQAKETAVKEERASGGVFISYTHRDMDAANYFFFKLKQDLAKDKIDVWFDPRLEVSADYPERIRQAINSCRVFVPLISNNVVSDANDGQNHFYRQTEWNHAMSRSKNIGGFHPDIAPAEGFRIISFGLPGLDVSAIAESDKETFGPILGVTLTAYNQARYKEFLSQVRAACKII